jgi:HD-GYP domain-containing protein (c-di-GMP phosphodiesterase class II)
MSHNGNAGKNVEIIKDAVNLLSRFHRAFRTSKIYDPNNLIYTRQIDLFQHLVNKFLDIYDKAQLTLRENGVYFNDIKLKFGFSNYYLQQFIENEFMKLDIGELSFFRGMDTDELNRFIHLLARKPAEENPHEEFCRLLQKNRIQNISVEKIASFQKSNNKSRDTKRIFFLSLTHLKEYFQDRQSLSSKTSLYTTKRLMQSIFNHLSENESFLYGMTNIKNFDEYTLNHSVNVCILTISLGKKLGLDRNELVDLGLAAFFHDFGKLDIPKQILLKPGKLDADERKEIEKHTFYGALKLMKIQQSSFLPVKALNVAMEHHYGETSSGYPHYTKKKTINLYSKIVKVVDVFDALTTPRPYRDVDYTRDEALRFMRQRSGTDFDPLILKVFIHMVGIYPVGTLVLLNSGEIGIIFETNPDPADRLLPKVKLITDSGGKKTDGPVIDLAETGPASSGSARFIVKSLNPESYEIRTADYFIAEAE